MGAIVNAIGIVVGSVVGLLFGKAISEKLQETLLAGLGIFVALTGVVDFLKTENSLIPLLGLVIGTVIGQLLKIEERTESFGGWLQSKYAKMTHGSQNESRERFINGFVTAALLFVIGPMGVLGSIQEGLGQGITTILAKTLIDCLTAVALTTAMGVGVGFSAIPVLIYQGAITLLAVQADKILTDTMINEMTACGGIMLVAIGMTSLLRIKKISVANMQPGLIIAPLLAYIASLF